MYTLTEGALDKIMSGIDIDKPILQILGHKKLASSSSGERYRLLISDGKRLNSFAMLATQLNPMITDNVLTEYSICQINRYAISMVNNHGKQKRVMVILQLDVQAPGSEVGGKIGNPTNADDDDAAKPTSPQASMQPVPQRQQRAVVPERNAHNNSIENISTVPIVALNPYNNRWVIKVRVVSKSGIRTWSNSKGEGKLFSMDLVDESGEIRCTAFRDQVDKFYDMIEVGKIYYLSRATMKTANKKFCHLKNDYELTLNSESEIIPCHDSDDEIPTLQFNFEPISEIQNKQENEIMDILAVVKYAGNVQTLVSRTTGKELKKRDIELIDESNTIVILTMWGTEAEEFQGDNNPVLALKSIRIQSFQGAKTLSTLSSSTIQIDPDISEAHRLRGWFNTTNCNTAVSISKPFMSGGVDFDQWLTLAEAENKKLGFHGHPDFFTTNVLVNLIRSENALYKACPTEACKKKLIDQANGMYRCEKCNKEFPNYRYRLIMSLNVADYYGSQWVTAFSSEAEKILGITAEELGELKENDKDAYLDKFSDAAFKTWTMKLRVQMEMFNDENRLRTTVTGISPVDYKLRNNHLITKIKEYVGISKT